MHPYFATLKQWLRSVVHDNGAVQGEATMETMRRFRIFAGFTLLVNMGYVAKLGFFTGSQASVQHVRWASAIGWAHGAMALAMAVLGLLIHRFCQSHVRASPQALVLQTLFACTALAFAVALSVIDQMVTTNTTNFATICLLVGMLSLMRPTWALAMFVGTYLVFFQALALTQRDPELLALARSHGLSAVLMSFVASTVMWHQYASAVLLRREIVRGNRALACKQSELEYLATHDALTGLYNRREFMRLAEMELVRSARLPSDTCVLMVDLDFFKKINDRYGHPAGDEVLQQVAAMLKNGVRASDVIARMGGEEFIVLLPSTDCEGALAVAEKLRCVVREKPLQVQGFAIQVTASIGVSGLKKSQRASIDGLYATADQALYVAKQSGRDRVEYLALEPMGIPMSLAD